VVQRLRMFPKRDHLLKTKTKKRSTKTSALKRMGKKFVKLADRGELGSPEDQESVIASRVN